MTPQENARPTLADNLLLAAQLQDALNETARLQARVSELEHVDASMRLVEQERDEAQARVEQLERERATLLEQKDASREEYEKLELRRNALRHGIFALEREAKALRAALRSAETHLEDLRDAWERGALQSHDSKNGLRSNVNHDTLKIVRSAFSGKQPDMPALGRVVEEKGVTQSAPCPGCGGSGRDATEWDLCMTCKGTGVETKT